MHSMFPTSQMLELCWAQVMAQAGGVEVGRGPDEVSVGSVEMEEEGSWA